MADRSVTAGAAMLYGSGHTRLLVSVASRDAAVSSIGASIRGHLDLAAAEIRNSVGTAFVADGLEVKGAPPSKQAAQAQASGVFHMKTPEQGAATSVFLATSPQVQGVGGRYFEDCHEAAVVEQLDGLSGVVPHALDPDAARRLWDDSEELVAAARAPRAG